MQSDRRQFLAFGSLAGAAIAGCSWGPASAAMAPDAHRGATESLNIEPSGPTLEFRGTGADDSQAINDALRKAAGGVLVVAGESRISSPIRIPSYTRLEAHGAVWRWPRDWSAITPQAMLVLEGGSHIVIEGLEIDGEHGSEDHHDKAVSAIVLGACNHIAIRNCYIHDLRGPDEATHWATGIAMRGNATNILIENNTIANVQRNCVSTWATTGSRRNTGIRILNNRLIKPRIRNCVLVSSSPEAVGEGDVFISGNELAEAVRLYAIRLSGSMNSIISNNHFRDNAGCINRNPLHGHRVIISGNLMRNTRGDVVHLNDSGHDANSTIFEHNIIEGAGGYTLRYLPRRTEPKARRHSILTITGNISHDSRGFRFSTDNNQGPDACRIQMMGNVVHNTHDSAIVVQGINRPLISGNRIDAGRVSGHPGIRVTRSEEPMIQGNLVTGFRES